MLQATGFVNILVAKKLLEAMAKQCSIVRVVLGHSFGCRKDILLCFVRAWSFAGNGRKVIYRVFQHVLLVGSRLQM